MRLTVRLLVGFLVLYFGAVAVIPGVRNAVHRLGAVNPLLLLTGLALEFAALLSYSLLTRAALGEARRTVSLGRVFRIQMSTKALSSIVPGGSAAGSALGYNLLTLSGVPGPDAGFALATAGLGSAVVLNAIFLVALLVSIPLRGVNPGYAIAALLGVLLIGAVAALVFGLISGEGRAERVVRWVARRLRMNDEIAAQGVHHIVERLEDLFADRKLLTRVIAWAAANWLLDAAALWVFLRSFGVSTDIDALVVAYALANVLAVLPLTPGGLGVIEVALTSALVGFGLPRSVALIGVASWRIADFILPALLGGALYGTLRVGPWSISRQQHLQRLREVASADITVGENALDFAVRFATRPSPGKSGDIGE